jgi:hypothetical protein
LTFRAKGWRCGVDELVAPVGYDFAVAVETAAQTALNYGVYSWKVAVAEMRLSW